VTVIDSRLDPRLGTGWWSTKEGVILPDDGEDRHADALHEGGRSYSSIERGIFALWVDILPLF
jgi:hypothetical protein